MNPYLDEDLITLGDHARRFATDRIAPGFLERDKTRELERRLQSGGSGADHGDVVRGVLLVHGCSFG